MSGNRRLHEREMENNNNGGVGRSLIPLRVTDHLVFPDRLIGDHHHCHRNYSLRKVDNLHEVVQLEEANALPSMLSLRDCNEIIELDV